MDKIQSYINPMNRLGGRDYSIRFPLVVMLSLVLLSEYVAYNLLASPDDIGIFAIALFLLGIIYFSFRDGIKGGMSAVVVTIIYYLYIIFDRDYTGDRFHSGVTATVFLGVIYTAIALIVGGLKQWVDILIGREMDEKLRLEAIIQQLPVGVLIADKEAVITSSNQQVKDILETDIPIGLQMGKTTILRAFHEGKEIKPSQSPLLRAIRTGEKIVSQEFNFAKKDGSMAFLHVNAAPIHNKEGEIIAGASIITDVTEQKEAEMRKDEFINMASHELKTPLTSVKLYLGSLQKKLEKLEDENFGKTVDSILYQIGRLQKLVDELLDVSRIQTGKLTFENEIFDLSIMAKDTVEELRDAFQDREIVFESDPDITICGDRFRIYQVLTNLVTNAVKYSEVETKVLVKIEKLNGEARMSVQDFGIGIAKNQQTKIFDRLYQVTDPKEKTFPGLGMGLYICKVIISRHNGKIGVTSRKGKGSTFYVTLPIENNTKKGGSNE